MPRLPEYHSDSGLITSAAGSHHAVLPEGYAKFIKDMKIETLDSVELAINPSPLIVFHRKKNLAAPGREPYPRDTLFPIWTDEGGLISYSTHLPDLFRRAATYVD